MSVTKVELADLVYEQMKIDKKDASELVDMFFEELKILSQKRARSNSAVSANSP